VCLLNTASDILSSEFITAREKLLALWDWVCDLRTDNRQVIQDINSDIKQLPTIENFLQAVTIIDAINLLQQELITMNSPLSDSDLIMSHTSKLSPSEMFRPLKIGFLQSDNQATEMNGPVLRRLKPLGEKVRQNSPTKSWNEYCSEVRKYHRTDREHRTSTVLSAVVATPTLITHSKEFQELQQQVFSIIQKDEEKKSDRGEWRQPSQQTRPYFTPQYKPRKENREHFHSENRPQSEQSIPRQHQSPSMSRYQNDHQSPRHPSDFQQQRYRQQPREVPFRTRQLDRYQNERHQPRKRIFSAMAEFADYPSRLFDEEGNLVCSINEQTDQEYEYELEFNQSSDTEPDK